MTPGATALPVCLHPERHAADCECGCLWGPRPPRPKEAWMDSTSDLLEANDLLELAWGIIANAGGGNWERESPEWLAAAKQWRDRYFARHVAQLPPPRPKEV